MHVLGLQLLGGASWEESKGQLLSAPLQQNLRASLQACEVKGLKKSNLAAPCSLLPCAQPASAPRGPRAGASG